MSQSESKSKFFKWTEEEEALLLKVIHEYKTTKLRSGQDWELIRSKCEDIRLKFTSSYPNEESEEFPNFNNKEEVTRERLAAKIKNIKTSFRKAVDSGRRSGGGRVTYALYNECYEVWAGCPAVESLEDRVESSSMKSYSATENDSATSIQYLDPAENDGLNENEGDYTATNDQPSSSSKESDVGIAEPLKKKDENKKKGTCKGTKRQKEWEIHKESISPRAVT